MKRLAVIPARGGSKRIPDKNIRDFCGKPMISYSLSAARDTKLFDVIHVSTESQKIIDVVENLGFPVDFPRPESLSDDYTPIMPVLRFVTETYSERGLTFDQVCLITACAPLIEAQHLLGAARLFDQFEGKRPVIAVAPYPVPVEWAFERSADAGLTPVNPGTFATRSQDLGVKHYDAGILAFFPTEHVLTVEGAGHDTDFVGYLLKAGEAVDIDDEDDLALAEVLYLGREEKLKRKTESATRLMALKSMITLPLSDNAFLRPLRINDITPEYINGLNDPEVHRFLEAPRKRRQNLETVREFVRLNWEEDSQILFGIYVDGILRGTTRTHVIDWKTGRAYVGIALFDRSVWGQGLAHRALMYSAKFSSQVLGIRQFFAGIVDANLRSRRVFEKAGYRPLRGTESKTSDGLARIWFRKI